MTVCQKGTMPKSSMPNGCMPKDIMPKVCMPNDFMPFYCPALKIGTIMQENITSLYSSPNYGKYSSLRGRDSLRQSRLSFLSFQSLPQMNQNLRIEKIDEEF